MKPKINRIAGYRAMLRLTQKDLANKLGISAQSYSNKENGRTPFNDLEKIKLKEIFTQIDKSLTIDDIFF